MAIMNEELDLMDTLYAKIAQLERERDKLYIAWYNARAEERERCRLAVREALSALHAPTANSAIAATDRAIRALEEAR